MQENIEQLLSILKSHVDEKRYASTIDLMWFLCRLFDDSVVEASTDVVSRLCQIATDVLPIIDNHVQEADIQFEFRNDLNRLGKAIFVLRQKKEIDDYISNDLKKLLDLTIQSKPVRSILWDNFTHLDWQSDNKTAFQKLERKRTTELRVALNQEVHLLSSNLSEKNQRALYLKTTHCVGRMLLPWFSTLIYQRNPSNIKKDVELHLTPIESLINGVLPFLSGDEQALGWELVHLYSYWVRDKSKFLINCQTLEGFIPSAMSSISQSLIALSYCARAVTATAYHNDKVALSTLCQYVVQLEKNLSEKMAVPLSSPALFNDHRKSLKMIRESWQASTQKSLLSEPTLPSHEPASIKRLSDQPLLNESIAQKQEAFSEGSIDLMRTLLKENVSILGEPPGKFALLLLGSSSRNDRLPYSDMECALIYEAKPEQAVQMRGYLYTLLTLLEFAVIRLGETQDFSEGGNAGFHFDSSDHILLIEKKLIGTVDELYQWHVESTLLQSPGDLVLTGDLGEEGKGQLLYALLTPCLVNADWGGRSLFLAYQQKVQSLLNTAVDAWTHHALKQAYFENKRIADQQHVLPKNLMANRSKKRLSEETWLSDSQDDFKKPKKAVALVTLRQIVALYCWMDILRKAEETLSKTKQNNPSVPNIKDIYHKPLVYLALNLQLFLETSEKHPIHMFEAAFAAGILPLGVKVLFQMMLSGVIQIRSDLHLAYGAQQEETNLIELSPEHQLILKMIEEGLLHPLKIAIEDLFKKNDDVESWRTRLREIFGKVWAYYSKKRIRWQTQLSTDLLLTGFYDDLHQKDYVKSTRNLIISNHLMESDDLVEVLNRALLIDLQKIEKYYDPSEYQFLQDTCLERGLVLLQSNVALKISIHPTFCEHVADWAILKLYHKHWSPEQWENHYWKLPNKKVRAVFRRKLNNFIDTQKNIPQWFQDFACQLADELGNRESTKNMREFLHKSLFLVCERKRSLVALRWLSQQADGSYRVEQRYLKQTYVDKLFDLDGNLSLKHRQNEGKSLVKCLYDDHENAIVYIKFYPHLPLNQYAVDSLCARMSGYHAQTTLGWILHERQKGKAHPVLLSMPIGAKQLKDKNSVTLLHHQLHRTDSGYEDNTNAKAFTWKFLETFLVQPRDEKNDNLVPIPVDYAAGTYAWISLDADCSFAASILNRSTVYLYSLIFLMNGMNKPLSEIAILEFLARDWDELLRAWLSELEQYTVFLCSEETNNKYLFSHVELQEYQQLRKVITLTGLGIENNEYNVACDPQGLFRDHSLLLLYQQIQRLCLGLKRYLAQTDVQALNHWTVMNYMDPKLGQCYREAYQKTGDNSTSSERFKYLPELDKNFSQKTMVVKDDLNSNQTSRRTFTMTYSASKHPNQIPGFLSIFAKEEDPIRAYTALTSQKSALAAFMNYHQPQQFHLLYESVQIQQDLTVFESANYPPFLREKVINRLHWESLQALKAENIIKLMTQYNFRVLRLKNCSVLTNNYLGMLIKNSPFLMELNVNACQLLIGNVGPLLENSAYLAILNLSHTNIKYITTRLGVGYVELPRLKRLVANYCPLLMSIEVNSEVLTHLYVIGSSKLKTIKKALLNPYQLHKFLGSGIPYAETIQCFPLLAGIEWKEYEGNFRVDITSRLQEIFSKLSIYYLHLSLSAKEQLLQMMKLHIANFIIYKKLLFLLLKNLVTMQNDPYETIGKKSEAILMKLRSMDPHVYSMIRSAILQDAYPDTLLQAEKIYDVALVEILKLNINQLTDGEISTRENALMNLGNIAYDVQHKINHHFYQIDFSQYTRYCHDNWGFLNPEMAKYLLSFLDQKDRITCIRQSKCLYLFGREVHKTSHAKYFRNHPMTGISLFFNPIKDENSSSEASSSSEEDSLSAEDMNRRKSIPKKYHG